MWSSHPRPCARLDLERPACDTWQNRFLLISQNLGESPFASCTGCPPGQGSLSRCSLHKAFQQPASGCKAGFLGSLSLHADVYILRGTACPGLPLSHAPGTDGIIWNPGHRGEALSPSHALPLLAIDGFLKSRPGLLLHASYGSCPHPVPASHSRPVLGLRLRFGPCLFGKSAAMRTLPSTASLSGLLLASPCSLCFPTRMWLGQPALSPL